MKKIFLVVFIGVCLLIVPQLRAENPHTIDEMEMTIFNPCTEEDVNIIALVHSFSKEQTNARRGHLKFHLNVQDAMAYGVDSSDMYDFEMTENHSANVSNDRQGVEHMTCEMTLTNQNTGVMYMAGCVQHITINANGEITAEFEIETEECIETVDD
jgi:hypothetical protein